MKKCIYLKILEDQLLLSVYGQLSCEELVFIHPSAPWHEVRGEGDFVKCVSIL